MPAGGFDTGGANVRDYLSPFRDRRRTPFVETLSGDGAFAFANVPPGAYTLTVYNGAATIEKQVEVSRGQNTVSFDGLVACTD